MNQKTKVSKSLLWFSIISMSMVFAGLTSAYIVRRSSGEWIFFDLPNQFFLSAILLLITSLFLNKSYYSLKKDKLSLSYLLCFFSFFTAVFFCYSQFSAWKQMYLDEIYFSGQKSHPAGSYVYVMSVLHLLHVFAGIILLLYNLLQFYKNKFSSKNTLTLDLTRIYWNFVDILWIYIIVFLFLVK
tara:strand:- start:578 stop:1132 length:555 start_codon:yes stop_codon:yes gene_type:complete